MPYKHTARFAHKHETPEDRRRRQQHRPPPAPQTAAEQMADFYRRTWQDGPPVWWMADHRAFQEATYLRLKETTDEPAID